MFDVNNVHFDVHMNRSFRRTSTPHLTIYFRGELFTLSEFHLQISLFVILLIAYETNVFSLKEA